MKSHPESEQILDDLGDKVVGGFGRCVAGVRTDLHAYRTSNPRWVADQSESGLAFWIHDRFWAHCRATLGDEEGVILVDEEPIREVWVGSKYRIRIKRLNEYDRLSAYPTQAALDFFAQPLPTLPGLEKVHLVAGYRWSRRDRTIGEAVISLHDGLDKPAIWVVELPEPDAGVPGLQVSPASPQSPTIVMEEDAADGEGTARA